MIDSLKSFWDYFGGDDGRRGAPAPIAPERLADPFSQLPQAMELTAEQQSWLEADLTVGHSMATLMSYQRAAAIRGPLPETHEKRRKRFAELQGEADELGFSFPAEFVTLMETDAYVNRLRFGCNWIRLPEFICRCPRDESHVMVLFLCEAQGCDYTHLLLAPDGSHCVTRTGHWYGQHPSPPTADSSDKEKEIYLYADSFAEFLCRESDEIREHELESSRTWTGFGDQAKDSGAPEDAVGIYQIALSYAPGSREIEERIATVGS